MFANDRKRNRLVKVHFVEHINYFPMETCNLFMRKHGFHPVKGRIVAVNPRTYTIPEFIAASAKRLMGARDYDHFSRYYRYG